MSRNTMVDVGFTVVMGVAALVFIASEPAGLLSPVALVRAACVVKLLFLALGAVLAIQVAARFEADNPIRPAWLHLGLGLAATALGQLGLAFYQFSPAGGAPFPSVADYFFFLSYPLFVTALISFTQAYEAAGTPLSSRTERRAWAIGLTGAALLVGGIIVKPVLLAPAGAQALFLNVSYLVLDLVLLVLAALLLQVSLPLRGGGVWKAWAALLAGFFFMSAGDVLFAYFQALGITAVDPFVHVTYVLAYGFLALGVLRQQRLLDTPV